MENKKIILAFMAFALAMAPAHAAVNVSIIYGWNGTASVPLLTSSDGALLTDLNFTSTGFTPKTNNTHTLGSSNLRWVALFTANLRSAGPLSLYAGGAEKVTVLAGGNTGIGNTDPQQKLVVSGQANVTGSTILNGTMLMKGASYNWPSADGSVNQVLTTNAAGTLTWANAGGGSPNISAANVTAGTFGASIGNGDFSFPNNISVSQNISASGRITDKTGFLTPVGTIAPYSGALAPAGWLIANGSEVNRTTYPDLFNITGTIYGNTSDSTFVLPDLRQRFALGKADSGTGSTLGGTGGNIDHTHTGPSHTHTYSTMIAHTHSADPPSTGSDSQGSHTHTWDPGSTASGTSSHTHSADPASVTTDSAGDHTHGVYHGYGGDGGGYSTELRNTAGTIEIASSGSHSHTYDIAAITSGAGTGHTHSTDIASFTSSSGGGSTHSTDIGSFTSGSTGSASGTSDAGGTGATGTGNAPFLAVNFIIKY